MWDYSPDEKTEWRIYFAVIIYAVLLLSTLNFFTSAGTSLFLTALTYFLPKKSNPKKK